MSSSTWAQLSTPLSTTYCPDTSEQHFGTSSLHPANWDTPRITHTGHLPRGTSSWQNATNIWPKMQDPSSLVSHPFATCPSPQPSALSKQLKVAPRGNTFKRPRFFGDIPLCLRTTGGKSCNLCLPVWLYGDKMAFRVYVPSSVFFLFFVFKQVWKLCFRSGSKMQNFLIFT